MLARKSLVAFVVSVVWIGSLAVAGDIPLAATDSKKSDASAAKSAKGGETADQLTIAQWIEQLDAADFSKREAASGKLIAKGKTAVPALEKAASQGNLEVSSRAMFALGKLLKSTDEATENAAREAVERIAGGDVPSASRNAKSILKKEEAPVDNAPNIMPGGFGGRIVINGGALQLGGGVLQIGGGAMKTMSVSNVNGVREIEASENGKSVKIHDEPNKSIKIEVTEKQNGKDVTKKYEAKNVDDLKKNHPSGYKLYKQYGEENNVAGMGGAVQFNIQGGAAMQAMPVVPAMPMIPLQPAMPPRQVPAMPAPQAPLKADAGTAASTHQIEIATMMLKTLSAQLESFDAAGACKNASASSKAELQKQVVEISKKLDELKRKLDEK